MPNAVDFQAFDADNHYYEALDAFTRHLEPQYRKRAMEWAEINGKRRLLVGGRVNRFIPNPTFDPVSKPGALDEYFRGQQPEERRRARVVRRARSDRGPARVPRPRHPPRGRWTSRAWSRRSSSRRSASAWSRRSIDDVPALQAAFHRVQPLAATTTGASTTRDRIFSAPFISLTDLDSAVAELEWALANDARIVIVGVGPGRHRRRRTGAVGSLLRPVLGPPERGRCHARAPRRRLRLQPLPARTGGRPPRWRRSARARCVTAVARPDPRHGGGDARRRVLPAPPEHPRGDRSSRQRVGVPPPQEAQEVVRQTPVHVPGGSGRDRCAVTSGCRRTTRTTSPPCATWSAPTGS